MQNIYSSIIELIIKTIIISFVIIITLVLILINYAFKIKNARLRLESINIKDYTYGQYYTADELLSYETNLLFYAVLLIIYIIFFVIIITFLKKLY